MQELLLGGWGLQIVAITQQYPWRVFAVLVLVLLSDMLFRQNRGTPSDADIGGRDCGGDGDGGGCGIAGKALWTQSFCPR